MNTFKYIIFSLGLTGLLFYSCVDADIEEAIPYDKYYATVDDADAAIMGIYGEVMGVADRLVVLNELRGDLLDVTANANDDLIEINLQKTSKDNYWTDVTPFYQIIQNCNDALYNFDVMLKEKRLTVAEYTERYSDIGAIRCWLYYQLGVQYGTIPYITKPVVDINDLAKQGEYMMNLDALIPELIHFMENLPTLEDYQTSKLITGTVDSYSLVPFFINKRCLLGDLYLFNNQYDNAAIQYRKVLSKNETAGSTTPEAINTYRLFNYVWTSGEVNYFAILFQRFKENDYNTYYNAWKNMFKVSPDDRYTRFEMIWEMSYDYKFAPTYPFVELFGTSGRGKYYLKPSKYAIDEMWGSEVQKNAFPYDCRGISGGVDKTPTGDYAVAKYGMFYDGINKPYEVQGKWFLYRAALLHLRYAEAANRSESGGGYPRLAWALVNSGINGGAFKWKNPLTGATCRVDSVDYTSYGPPPATAYPAPYYIDARNNNTAANGPTFLTPWRSNAGVRGRANLPSIDMSTITTKQDSINFIENMIVKEAGLELAFEGHRWTDLIRVARRLQKLNGTGGQFLYNKMHRKYELAGLPVPDFNNEANWYLPLYR